jgi:hypothetical protein
VHAHIRSSVLGTGYICRCGTRGTPFSLPVMLNFAKRPTWSGTSCNEYSLHWLLFRPLPPAWPDIPESVVAAVLRASRRTVPPPPHAAAAPPPPPRPRNHSSPPGSCPQHELQPIFCRNSARSTVRTPSLRPANRGHTKPSFAAGEAPKIYEVSLGGLPGRC